MAEHSIVQSAKQGDPAAIAYLITHSLQNYGITARANRQGLCLKLLLEAEQVPYQSTMVKLVTQGMQKLNVESLQMVKLYGRQLGQPTAAWRHVIELLPQVLDIQALDIQALDIQALDIQALKLEQAEGASLSSEADRSVRSVNSVSSVNPASNGAVEDLETPLFQMEDLDPDAMILLPIDPELQLEDLDPDSLILFPVDPIIADEPEAESEPASNTLVPDAELSLIAQPDLASPHPSADRLAESPAEASEQPSEPFTDLPTDLPTDSIPEISRLALAKSAKPPQRLTLLLLGLLWFCLLTHTLGLIVSLLKAVSFSLYAGLDLSSTNQPFAGLLLGIVGLAGFIFAPFSRLSLGLTLAIGLLSLWWLHRVHLSLRNLLGQYPISPLGAVVRLGLPMYNIWGIGQIWLTLAQQLAQVQLIASSRVIRRLTAWFYLALAVAVGLQVGDWVRAEGTAAFFDSFWFDLLQAAAIWTLTLVWLRLIRITWRALRQLYKTRVARFLPAKLRSRRQRSVSFSAILLGSGASLLSLGLFNGLLGLIAAVVFLLNGLRPESIFQTFSDSESLLVLMLLGSAFCIGLGGCVTASLTERSRWLHALGLGCLLTLLGLALRHLPLFPALAELPFWFQTASAVLIIPAALLGCGLRQWLRRL